MSTKVKEYLNAIATKYNLFNEEVEILFAMSVGKAYNAVGSAYVWGDGTITVAIDLKGRGELFLKHYVISAKMYEKIVNVFENKVREYSLQRELSNFIFEILGSNILVEVIKEESKCYIVKTINTVGMANKCKYRLPKNKCFFNEKFYTGEKILVNCRRYESKEKYIVVSRIEKDVIKEIFEEMFHKLKRITESNFSYKDFDVYYDFRKKSVFIFVNWIEKPNGYFLKKLCEELKNVFKRCNIYLKKSED